MPNERIIDPDVRVLPSVCPLDCPDTCRLSVTVKNEQVVRVRGSRSNLLTEGVERPG